MGRKMDLAERYRPIQFKDMWQYPESPTLRAVTNEVQRGRLQGPMLVTGGYGVGKTTLARIIGRRGSCLNGSDHPFEPCGSCDGCKNVEVRRSTSWCEYGYFEIDCTQYSAARVRDMVAHETQCQLFRSAFKRWVVCLDEVGRREFSYQRQLLKMIENVRAHIILCSGDPDLVDPALRSRCVIRPLQPPSPEQCLSALRRIVAHEKVRLCPSASPLLVQRLGCNPRKILKTLATAISLADDGIGIEEVEAALAMGT